MAIAITYKSNQLSSFSSGTKTLKTAGKYMEDDVTVSIVNTATIGTLSAHRNYLTYKGSYCHSNSTFTFSAGDTLSIEVYGEMTGCSIYEDDIQIGSCDNNSPYTYTLPNHDIAITAETNGGGARCYITSTSVSNTPTSQTKTVTPSASQQIILPDSYSTASPTAAVTNSTSSTSYILPLYLINTTIEDAVYIRLNGDVLLAKGSGSDIWKVTFNNAIIGPIDLEYSNGRYNISSSSYTITQITSGNYSTPYDIYFSMNRYSNAYNIYFDTYEETTFTTKTSFSNFTIDWSETSNTFTNYDYLSQVTVNGDANLIGSNIISGTSIFGVAGTFTYTNYSVGTTAPSNSSGSNGDLYFQTNE